MSMKMLIIYLSLLLISSISYSQGIKPPNEVVNDFAFSYYYKYKFEKNKPLHNIAYLAGQSLGYSYIDIEIAVEKMDTNSKFREEVYQVLFELAKGDEEYLALNLSNFGMRATNANKLAKYICFKFGKPVFNKPENIKPELVHPVEDISSNNKSKALFSRQGNNFKNRVDASHNNYTVLRNIYTIDSLLSIYGSVNVKIKDAFDEEGTNIGSEYLIYSGTKDEVTIRFGDDEKSNNITFNTKESAWKLPTGLCVGMPLKEVIAINGRDFSIYGFEWDYSGTLIDWNNGNLQKQGVSIALAAPESVDGALYNRFIGDKQYSTSNQSLQKLGLFVRAISFQNTMK